MMMVDNTKPTVYITNLTDNGAETNAKIKKILTLAFTHIIVSSPTKTREVLSDGEEMLRILNEPSLNNEVTYAFREDAKRASDTFKRSVYNILLPELFEHFVAGDIMDHMKRLVSATGAEDVDVDKSVALIAKVLQATNTTSLDAAAASITSLKEKLGVITLEEGTHKIDSILQVTESTTIAGAASKVTSLKMKVSSLEAGLPDNKSVKSDKSDKPTPLSFDSPSDKLLNGTDSDVGVGVGSQRSFAAPAAAAAADSVSQLSQLTEQSNQSSQAIMNEFQAAVREEMGNATGKAQSHLANTLVARLDDIMTPAKKKRDDDDNRFGN